MCGIVGLIGNIGYTEKKMFRTLHLLDIFRGADSSGIIRVDDTYQSRIIKCLGTPDNLIPVDDEDTENTEKFFSYKSGLVNGPTICLIGHNRKATIGGISIRAAHPFDFPNIVGVHNGTIPHYTYSKMENYVASANDSEALYFEIDKYGVEEVYKKHSGAFACAAWEKATGQLLLWRNEQRPLTTRFSRDKTRMMFASEPWMMDVAINIERATVDEWEDKYFVVPVDTLFSVYTTKDGTVAWNTTKLTPPATTVSSTFHGPFGQKSGAVTTYKGTAQTAEEEKGKVPPKIVSKYPPTDRAIDCHRTVATVSYNRSQYYWWNPHDEKFHLNTDYTITLDKVEGFVYKYEDAPPNQYPHRFYVPHTKVSTLFDGMEDDGDVEIVPDDPDANEASFFYGSTHGNLPRNSWHEVVFSNGKPVFFPPERSGVACRISEELANWVVWSRVDRKWYLTQSYEFPTNKKTKEEKKTETSERVFEGPFGELFPEDAYEELLLRAHGCAICGSFPTPDCYHTVKWSSKLTEPTFICETCCAENEELYYNVHLH